MEKLESTAPTTGELETAIRERLPEFVALADRIFGVAQRSIDAPATARKARTLAKEAKEAAVANFYLDHRMAFAIIPKRQRTEAVRSKLKHHLARYGLDEVPPRKLVKRVIDR